MNTETKILSIKGITWGVVLGVLSLAYAYISNGFSSSLGWSSFLAVFILLSLLTMAVWKYFQGENVPKYLLGLVILAIVIRLSLGVLWTVTIPEFGYDTEIQNAGYVMGDAYSRDTAAWDFSQTDVPLIKSFDQYSYTDQYGGLIFLSALVYRYLGTGVHQPLLMAVFSAFISSLAVFFVWGIAKKEFGEKVAKLSAWFLVLYPEAVLMGSSQMREAYSVTLMTIIVYLFIRFVQNRKNQELFLLMVALIFSYYLSKPFAFSILSLLGVLVVWKLDWTWTNRGNHWLKKIFIFILLLAFIWGFSQSIDAIFGVSYQEYLSLQASGKLSSMFERIPEILHRPFLVSYGVVRPLLPAALANLGNVVWGSISVWRSLGWTVMLTLLLYSTFMVFKEKVFSKMPGAFLLFVWFGVIIASYRGAGDDWDNPRYRVVFAGLQMILAAWAIIRQRESKDPWLRRGIGFVVSMVIWFMVWYIDRYIYYLHFSARSLTAVIGLGLACGVLFLIWDWLRTQYNIKNN